MPTMNTKEKEGLTMKTQTATNDKRLPILPEHLVDIINEATKACHSANSMLLPILETGIYQTSAKLLEWLDNGGWAPVRKLSDEAAEILPAVASRLAARRFQLQHVYMGLALRSADDPTPVHQLLRTQLGDEEMMRLLQLVDSIDRTDLADHLQDAGDFGYSDPTAR